MKNQVYEVQFEGCDLEGKPITGTKTYPAYTCGHCSNIILIRPDRGRERKTCLSCGRWTCEKSEICNTHCTPIHSMANDHFEGVGQFGKYVNAIMNGIQKVSEAERLGLV